MDTFLSVLVDRLVTGGPDIVCDSYETVLRYILSHFLNATES